MMPISLNQVSACLENNIISTIQHGSVYVESKNNGSSHENKSPANQNEGKSVNFETNFKPKLSKNRTDYLKEETVRKMDRQLLTEKQISKQKLAKDLGITVKSLLQFCSSKFPAALISKINLQLIKFYCETKFNNNNQEEKKDAINKF